MEQPQLPAPEGDPEGTAAFGNGANPRQPGSWETTGIFGEAFPSVPAEVTPGQRLRALNTQGCSGSAELSPLLFPLSCSCSLIPQDFSPVSGPLHTTGREAKAPAAPSSSAHWCSVHSQLLMNPNFPSPRNSTPRKCPWKTAKAWKLNKKSYKFVF